MTLLVAHRISWDVFEYKEAKLDTSEIKNPLHSQEKQPKKTEEDRISVG
jgi:hypothetical protein